MKKFLTSLLFFLFAFAFKNANSQILYQNIYGLGSAFNPGLGASGTPIIVFDDVNILNTDIPETDSMSITKLKIGIMRLPASPASVIKVYATPFNKAAKGYDSFPAIPPVYVGMMDIPANPERAAVSYSLEFGDSVHSIFNFKTDPNNVFTDYTTIFIGLSFSNKEGAGWELSDGPGDNADVFFTYDKDDAVRPRRGRYFGGDPAATFQMQVFGKPAVSATPVILTNFDVQTVNDKNVLNWSTSQESNSDYYSVEHSTDGNNFEAIGQVDAAGNSSNSRTYSYTDANPVAGVNYYRLKMVDLDNSAKYSDIKSVRNSVSNMSFRAYPNPAFETLYLDIPSNRADAAILSVNNISGQVVFKNEIKVTTGMNTVPVKVNNLSAGTYIIKVQVGNQNFMQKFNKL